MSDQSVMVNGMMNGQQPRQAQEPTYNFTFSHNEWMVIRAGLYELPAKIANPIIGKLEPLILQAQTQAATLAASEGVRKEMTQ